MVDGRWRCSNFENMGMIVRLVPAAVFKIVGVCTPDPLGSIPRRSR